MKHLKIFIFFFLVFLFFRNVYGISFLTEKDKQQDENLFIPPHEDPENTSTLEKYEINEIYLPEEKEETQNNRKKLLEERDKNNQTEKIKKEVKKIEKNKNNSKIKKKTDILPFIVVVGMLLITLGVVIKKRKKLPEIKPI